MKTIFCLIFILAGCSNQERLDAATIACRDHVQYLMMGAGAGRTIVPHMTADGKVYTC